MKVEDLGFQPGSEVANGRERGQHWAASSRWEGELGAKDPESRSWQRNVSGAVSSQPWVRAGAGKHTSSADPDGTIHTGGLGKKQ